MHPKSSQRQAKSRGVRGFTYLPVQEVADLPLDKLLERIEALQSGDKKTSLLQAPAVLGLVEKPSMNISDALDQYWDLTRDQTFSKSKDQIRRCKNPRKKAIRNFINVVGDIKLSDISANHMLEYRAWNSDRIQDGEIVGGSANKELTQLGHVLKTVNETKSLEFDPYLKSLKPFNEGEKSQGLHSLINGYWKSSLRLEHSQASMRKQGQLLWVW